MTYVCLGCDPCPLAAPGRVPTYEVHVTVPRGPSGHLAWACRVLGVKQTTVGMPPGVPTQHMTSETVEGGWEPALRRQVRALRMVGLPPTRLKVEAAPWNPEVPTLENGLPFAAGQYLEAHVKVVGTFRRPDTHISPEGYWVNLMRDMGHKLGFHVSRNPVREGAYFATRRDTVPLEVFQQQVRLLEEALVVMGFRLGRTTTEFAVLDTNLEMDRAWLAS